MADQETMLAQTLRNYIDTVRKTPDQRGKVSAEVLAAIRPYYDSEQVNFTACIVVEAGVRQA